MAHLSTQQLCHAKRYEFEGVRPWVTEEELGSRETRDGKEQMKVEGAPDKGEAASSPLVEEAELPSSTSAETALPLLILTSPYASSVTPSMKLVPMGKRNASGKSMRCQSQ